MCLKRSILSYNNGIRSILYSVLFYCFVGVPFVVAAAAAAAAILYEIAAFVFNSLSFPIRKNQYQSTVLYHYRLSYTVYEIAVVVLVVAAASFFRIVIAVAVAVAVTVAIIVPSTAVSI